jgi:hypothetical protein
VTVVPSPNCPLELFPQQKTAADTVTPQLWYPPVETLVKVVLVLTNVGVDWFIVVPSPN